MICSDKEDALFFESLVQHTPYFKAAANWTLGPLRFYCNEKEIPLSSVPLSFSQIAGLIEITETGRVNFNNASVKILPALIAQANKTAEEVVVELNLEQESNDEAVSMWALAVITLLPEKVREFKAGKKGLIGMFAGEVKKLSKGKADMQVVNKILLEKLNQ